MMMLGQVPIPDKMPDTAGQAIIYIAVACIAGLIAAMTFGVKWLLGYMNDMRADTKELAGKFAEESEKARETFKAMSEANREAHAQNLDSILKSHEATQEKTLSTFDRHIERLSTAIEGKLKSERKLGSA